MQKSTLGTTRDYAHVKWTFRLKAVAPVGWLSQFSDGGVTTLQHPAMASDLPYDRLFLGKFLWL